MNDPNLSASLPGVGDPVRWANVTPESLGAAGRLLVSPPAIMALPSDVAMRVRGNVLRVPAPTIGPSESGSMFARNAAALKLGGIAIGAALFGAGAMTAISTVRDPSELRVVVAPTPQTATDERALLLEQRGSDYAAEHRANTAMAGQRNSALSREALMDGQEPGHDAERNAGVSHGRADESLTTTGRHSVATVIGAAEIDGGQGVSKAAAAAKHPPSSQEGGEAPQVRRLTSPSTEHASVVPNPRETGGVSLAIAAVPSVGQSSHAAEEELRLLSKDVIERPVVRPQFRRVTTARKPISLVALSSLEEETRLLEEARSKLGRAPDTALTLALEHQTRFRQGQLLEQRRMIHLEALLRLGRDDEAKKLASTIGSSIYQARANVLLVRYGIVVE